jgi:pimeloyl-ACP methyl ester carboxylesterase
MKIVDLTSSTGRKIPKSCRRPTLHRKTTTMMRLLTLLFLLLVRPTTGFFQDLLPKALTPIQRDETFEAPKVAAAGITEELCIDTAARMNRVQVPVRTSIHLAGTVGISYSHWKANARPFTRPPPTVVLLHGFDSSNLEFRRLGSRLAERGIDTYAVDILGWGYTQLDGVTDFSAAAKVEALQSFLQSISTIGDFCIAGASLGGAAAIETAVSNPACKGLILIDAQGFVDGIGPMAMLPQPIAKLGVQVLKSIPLRSSANQMSYFDKKTYATDEAVTVGRLHCLREGWSDSMVNFMQSGGFSPTKLVPLVKVPTLVLWGREDGILEGKEYANKFTELIPDSKLQWIEACGHVPHLEQPECVASP